MTYPRVYTTLIAIVVFVAIILVAAILSPSLPSTFAQGGGGGCDRNTNLSLAAAATQVIAPAEPGTTVYVCAYSVSGDTLATVAIFQNSTTDLWTIRLCDECTDSIGNGTGIVFQSTQGELLQIAAGTGAIRGGIRWGRR